MWIIHTNIWRRSNFRIRNHIVAEFEDLGLSQKHVVIGLIKEMFLSGLGCANNGSIEDHHVLFIDGQPVFDTGTIFFKENRGEFDKGIHGSGICPTTDFVQFVLGRSK